MPEQISQTGQADRTVHGDPEAGPADPVDPIDPAAPAEPLPAAAQPSLAGPGRRRERWSGALVWCRVNARANWQIGRAHV